MDPYRDFFAYDTRARLAKLGSPRYVVSKTRWVILQWRHPELPWIAKGAIDLMDGYLVSLARPSAVEWGSGKSTMWLGRRCSRVIAVEHNAGWYQSIQDRLDQHRLANVDLRLVNEEEYVRAADDIPAQSIDVVLVDGLFRDEVSLQALSLLRPGGWLVIDNINWYLPSATRSPHSLPLRASPLSDAWSLFAESVVGWTTHWTTNGVNDTGIFVRPLQ